MVGALCCFTIFAAAAVQQDAAAKSERASRAMFEERFAEAESLYKELLSADPDNPGLLLNLGLAEQSLGNHRDAVKQFRAVTKLRPEDTMVWFLLGATYRKLGEPAEAIQPLERVLESEPSNHAAALELAEALFALEKFEDAATRFYRLAEMEPSNPRAWQGLGTCYVRLARRATSELGRGSPNSAFWLALSGRERAEAARMESAFALYRKALAKDPNLRGVHSALAEIYAAAGHDEWAKVEEARESKLPPLDCAKAVPECELRDQRYWQAVEAASKLGGAQALYWRALGYFELARIAFSRLAELPMSAEQVERMAETHRLMGRHREAVKMWREALALAPEDARLQKELSRSLADQREESKAAELEGSAKVTPPAQDPVMIRVDASVREGPLKPIWSYFGYDEPNYTYMKYGPKLVSELSALSPVPVHIRAHHLLCTGDGTAALKWGSTNAYTEDAAGKPVYDWTIVDRIFDTYVKAKAKPFVEIGFMPEALSVKPQPYATKWRQPDSGTGWSYPPKDYQKWGELVYQWVRHSVERYGRAEVETWYWELWNEPDIFYWRGTPAEYNRLYDSTAAAVKRALPAARVGGPATTDPANPKAAAFLRQFLEHCARGTPLDFIAFHAKGSPKVVDGRVQMGLSRNLQNVAKGYEIVSSFPQFRNLPIILSEYDPEGCAACSARMYPQNAYRNGTLYPCYIAASIKNVLLLADRYKTNIEGLLTWAFEFEDQPYFDGFRTLATNGIDKPVLNVFRMAGLMRGDRVKVESSGAVGLDAILKDGVRGTPDVDALAARSEREVTVMAWNYHDDDVPGPDAAVRMAVAGIPASATRVLLRHHRIDRTHSNAYTVWMGMGSPQSPSPEQYARLEAAGQLELLESPRWVRSEGGKVEIPFALPRQGVSLLQLSW